QVIDRVVDDIRSLLDDRLMEKLVWASMKAVYSTLIARHEDWEIAETFFNSVTRRIFSTVGVDPQIEFVATDFDTPPTFASDPVYRAYEAGRNTAVLLHAIFSDFNFQAPFAHLEEDVRAAAAFLDGRLAQMNADLQQIDMVMTGFYRGKSAYLIGRLVTQTGGIIPFVLALQHDEKGIYIDSVLCDENSASILFSFARSYFHVQVERPYDLVQFLHTIMPRKRIAEIYISLGYNKHGKTELYRDLLNHLARSDEQFHIAPGQRGMVMTVFVLPDYDLVFKIIKDKFSYPKKTTRREVVQKYKMVFLHDRAGRLIDAQSFEHLKFRREQFAPELLAELREIAPSTVQVNGDSVIVAHAYVERRVIPLDIYLREEAEAAAQAAVLDYGQAIKDLAATNIFPGDMLLKNFGVTRHGRVVFYDYDELRPLTSVNFRRFPQAASYEDDLFDEPWFHVNEDDVFPEEFMRFMGLPYKLRGLFIDHHGDLLDVEFWQTMQKRIQGGEYIGILPYTQNQRLRPG
ncbi:MAG TPA: bifunctional isocitrate dehydrogenase kinase/phosphatase, partial [Chloroflexi bacterium]|nr:bifunctional isocitrate dehydrogenase kinase/phosphatase [Chloroflexota bacterium]